MSNGANGANDQNQEQDMSTLDRFALLPGEEDFDVILNDPDFVPASRTSGAHKDGHSAAAAMAKADAPTNRGTGSGKGTTSATGASEKQVAYITSLAEERGLEVQARWLTTKAAASAAIDKLLATKPDAPVATAHHPASAKQIAFVRTLLSERTGNPDAEAIRTALNEARIAAPLTAALLSACITALLEIPKEAPVAVEAGVYVLANGNLARVYFGQQSGGMLLKEVVDGELVYQGKADRFLAGSRKATVEEVGNWGRTTGTCLVCSRKLDDPESVDRGIGPVCYSRMTEGG